MFTLPVSVWVLSVLYGFSLDQGSATFPSQRAVWIRFPQNRTLGINKMKFNCI